MVAKFLLPSFGGAAAVWSTCLVFFQSALLAGYGYAHFLRTSASPIRQRLIHISLLALSLIFLPPRPDVDFSKIARNPIAELLLTLATSVGLPFLALAATAPLLMEWFRQQHPNRSPHRLYAISNVGSLSALLSYPFLIEPKWGRNELTLGWGIAFTAFAVLCSGIGWKTRKVPSANNKRASRNDISDCNQSTGIWWLWISFAACGTALLLAITNQISQDVASMPLLWIGPMAVYLLTFILCFESPRLYKRQIFIPCCFVALLLLAWLLKEGFLLGLWLQIACYLAVLFFACMACHGELYRLRPPSERLTAYYLCVSLGGALGGMFVALLSPQIFQTLLETPLIALFVSFLLVFVLWQNGRTIPTALGTAATGMVLIAHVYVHLDSRKNSVLSARNFYGVFRVTESPILKFDRKSYPLELGVARVLHSGQIYHGIQFISEAARRKPTAYFSEESGLGLVFRNLPSQTNRHIGIIGLGAGTIATYAQPGDRFRFYELNPLVEEIARSYFTYLSEALGKIEVVLGDGRRSLEMEADQNFDLFVLDAFSGDSVPLHLLTLEAMQTYIRHLKPTGVIAFHISNSHLDLEPIVRALARENHMIPLLHISKDVSPSNATMTSYWILLSKNVAFFRQPEVSSQPNITFGKSPILWTDDHSSVIPILK